MQVIFTRRGHVKESVEGQSKRKKNMKKLKLVQMFWAKRLEKRESKYEETAESVQEWGVCQSDTGRKVNLTSILR